MTLFLHICWFLDIKGKDLIGSEEGGGCIVRDFTNAMKLFVLAHIGLAIIYYFFYSFLTINEQTPSEVSKNMLVTFTIVNVFVYFLSNHLNQEKPQVKQMKSDYFIYAFFASEAVMTFIAFVVLGK